MQMLCNKQTFVNQLNLKSNIDVARPDKISGADINSICQEVCLY